MIRRAFSLAAGIAITAAALWWLVTPDVVREFEAVAAAAHWPALAAATALSAVVQWLRAWRFSMMTSGHFGLPEWKLVRIAFQLNLLNFVLPFRLGELSYPVMMRRAYGQPVLHAAGVLLLVRLFDLFTVGAILAFVAALLGLAGTGRASVALFAIAAALAAMPLAFALAARRARLTAYLPANGWLARTIDLAVAAAGARRVQFAAILLSLAIWLVFGGLAALAAKAVVSGMPLAVALLGASASNLAFALPINGIGGLGPAQAAWVVAVSQTGVAWGDAVISAFALHAVTLLGAVLFGGLASLAGTRSGTLEREAQR
jgi:uncharacterized membrane protein YbhN (UPF0104 family)